jgi:FAD/FMN-containing dehydrogenase
MKDRRMNRRQLLRHAATIPLLFGASRGAPAWAQPAATAQPLRRVRPTDPSWPSPQVWQQLNRDVHGRLFEVTSPLRPCRQGDDDACNDVLKQLKNPYFIGDEPGLTQTLGWLDAWRSQPSAYAVAARTSDDVAAAVNFAREHRLRLVIKGGGHSYQGTSNAPDSLLIWTRQMKEITLHDAFVARGCEGRQAPQHAVSVGAGATWGAVYDRVTTRGGRYVQGGGCLSVGVAGLIQSGGFGSFSKQYGLAAAGLLEAEIVTADGVTRIANACTHPDLFWGLKGGGGGSLGVVSRLTLKTRELSEFVGGAFIRIRASSDTAFRALIARTLQFYRDSLFNPHWGEQIIVERRNAIRFGMLFHGLGQREAEQVWKPFLDMIAAQPQDYSIDDPVLISALPARHGWDYDFFRTRSPGTLLRDDRPDASPDNLVWAGDRDQAAQFIHAYKSAWLPASLLQDDRRLQFADALFACSRHWQVSLHVNKGLAGAPPAEIEAARDTATNPVVLDAFALAIIAGESSPALARLTGREPNFPLARERADAIGKAMDELRQIVPAAGSYLAESDFFERNWQRAFWGDNYPRLAEVKKTYDPDGLFFVHHGVGSEDWSPDGFIRVR